MHPIAEKISSLERRFLRRRRLIAASSVAAVTMAAAMVLGLADYSFRFTDRGLRLMATAGFVFIVVWAAYRWWLVPRRRRLGPLTVARRIEVRFPELRDSLASAVEFLEQSENDATTGSPALRRLVVAEAENASQHLALEDVIDRRPLRRAAGWLALAVVVAVTFIAMDRRAVGTATVRLIAPLGSTDWPRQNHLEFRDPPTRLAAGQTFEVVLIDTQGDLPEDVHIEYRAAEAGRRKISREPMTPIGNVMVAQRENVRQPFAFRAVGGDDHSMRWHEVEVVEPPQLASLSLVVHPPGYTGLPATSAERHLDVLAGSSIEVKGAANEPLGAARILLADETRITATIASNNAGESSRQFDIAPNEWIATNSAKYRIELEDTAGVAGVAGEWNLRVTNDPPPSISWQRPTDDLYVTTEAMVPLELVVKDNLAVQSVELVFQRVDQPDTAETRVELYRAPLPDANRDNNEVASEAGEVHLIRHAWNLDALRLPSGAQLLVRAEAMDHRPGTSQTVSPRRITIITAAELEARLAERIANIVRQLERALATQRTTRIDVRRLEIQQRDAGNLTEGDRNSLQTAELAQRRVGRVLSDRLEGVPGLVAAIIAELDISHVRSPGIRRSMAELSTSLDRLAAGPLPAAEGELTAARKSTDAAQVERLTDSLVASGVAQDEISAELERLLNELSTWANYNRFARELAELREEQLAHAKRTREEVGVETLPLEPSELTRDQKASLNKAAAGEDAIAGRFENIEDGMIALAEQLAGEDPAAAGILRDAAELAADLAIASDMQAAAQHLEQNRVGRALELEANLADNLQQMLDILRNRTERDAERLVDKIAKAEERLAALREQLAALREQLTKTEQQAVAVSPDQQQELAQQRQLLQQRIAELARELKRMQAGAASESTQQAADQLRNDQPSASQNAAPQSPQPPLSNQARQAEQKLADAARQLAQRRAEAEQDLALEFMRRFQTELEAMLARQRKVVRDTADLDAERKNAERLSVLQSRQLDQLADEERDMATGAREQSELLMGLAAIRLALEETAGRLDAAAKLLDERQTGAAAQQAEQDALERLEGIAEAFAQTAAEARPNQADEAGDQAGAGAGEPPQRRPTFELLEVKILRMLQVDLNKRTREFEERLTDPSRNVRDRADFDRQAEELSAQQGRLAKLVEEMLNRDND